MLGVLDLLQMFPSLRKISMDVFFQLTDRLMPRYYTIASSNLLYPNEVKIALALTIDQQGQGDQKIKFG